MRNVEEERKNFGSLLVDCRRQISGRIWSVADEPTDRGPDSALVGGRGTIVV